MSLGITDVVTPEPLEGVVEILDDNIFEPITGIVDDMLSVFW